jgi:hypothetical protein
LRSVFSVLPDVGDILCRGVPRFVLRISEAQAIIAEDVHHSGDDSYYFVYTPFMRGSERLRRFFNIIPDMGGIICRGVYRFVLHISEAQAITIAGVHDSGDDSYNIVYIQLMRSYSEHTHNPCRSPVFDACGQGEAKTAGLNSAFARAA